MANKNNSNEEKQEELSAEDYAIIGAGLTALGDFFAFLSLLKAKEATKETDDNAGVSPLLYIRSKKRKRP